MVSRQGVLGVAVASVVAIVVAVLFPLASAVGQTAPPTSTPAVIKDTNYAIPSGATFVSTTGNDANPGTMTSPWRTIQKAVNATPSGGTIVVRAGTYRESVALSNKTLTIQPYPHEQVWVKGSVVVTGWKQHGSIWQKTGWTYSFPPLTLSSGYIDPSYPMAGYPEMVFINGTPLTQVASLAAVGPGAFFVDSVNHVLDIGSNPSRKTVEATAFQNDLVIYNAPNSVIQGLGFADAASRADSASSAVIVNTSNNVVIQEDTFAWNAASGVEVGQLSSGVIVRNNDMVDNGLVGATTWGEPTGLVFQGNYVAYNNQQHFSIYWAAGGVKLNGVINATVSDNVVQNNVGTGIWCDNGCSNVDIVRNMVSDNSYQGIMFEISNGAIIASNIEVDNASSGGSGVLISASTSAEVLNNTIVDATVANARAIDVSSDSRQTTSGIVIENNIYSMMSTSSLWVTRVQDNANQVPASNMVSMSDYNAYYRTSMNSAAIEVRWGMSGGYNDFPSLPPFRASTSKEAHGLDIVSATNPFFLNPSAGNFQLLAGSVAIGAGAPLPQNVASAIGVTAGVPVNLGALVWPAGS